MKQLSTRRYFFAAIFSVAVTCTAVAQTDVTFFDGGLAELCTSAALNVKSPEHFELTGSRLTVAPMEICTMAIEGGSATIDELAASYNNRGVLWFDQGNLDAALKDFDEALAVRASLAEAHVNRGYVLVAKQRWQESLDAFNKGIELGAPELAKAHYNRGIAHEELGKAREAYYDYLKASELDPVWQEPKQELSRFTVKR